MRVVLPAVVALCLLSLFESPAQAAEPARLISAQKEKALRRLLPATDSEALEDLFAAPDLLFYTETEMPRAYQFRGGFLDANVNVSAKQGEPYGNCNREFPWGHPAGTHRAKGASKFTFVRLPGAIQWWQESLPRVIERNSSLRLVHRTEDETVTRWRYPAGTVFCEVLLLEDPDGVRRPFEVRTRTRGKSGWRPASYRPFRTYEEFRAFLEREKVDVERWESGLTVSVERLRSSHPDGEAFDRQAAVQMLPELPAKVVTEALSRPFQSVSGMPWTSLAGVAGHAPTTRAAYHVVRARLVRARARRRWHPEFPPLRAVGHPGIAAGAPVRAAQGAGAKGTAREAQARGPAMSEIELHHAHEESVRRRDGTDGVIRAARASLRPSRTLGPVLYGKRAVPSSECAGHEQRMARHQERAAARRPLFAEG